MAHAPGKHRRGMAAIGNAWGMHRGFDRAMQGQVRLAHQQHHRVFQRRPQTPHSRWRNARSSRAGWSAPNKCRRSAVLGVIHGTTSPPEVGSCSSHCGIEGTGSPVMTASSWLGMPPSTMLGCGQYEAWGYSCDCFLRQQARSHWRRCRAEHRPQLSGVLSRGRLAPSGFPSRLRDGVARTQKWTCVVPRETLSGPASLQPPVDSGGCTALRGGPGLFVMLRRTCTERVHRGGVRCS